MISITPYSDAQSSRISHIAQIAELEAECFPHGPWAQGSVKETLARLACGALIANDESGAAIGYIIWRLAGGEAEILRLGVSPSQRRKGIGKTLVKETVRQLRARDCIEVFLECRAGNLAAIGLYRGEGFTLAGTRKAYYRAPEDDAAVLRLLL